MKISRKFEAKKLNFSSCRHAVLSFRLTVPLMVVFKSIRRTFQVVSFAFCIPFCIFFAYIYSRQLTMILANLEHQSTTWYQQTANLYFPWIRKLARLLSLHRWCHTPTGHFVSSLAPVTTPAAWYQTSPSVMQPSFSKLNRQVLTLSVWR